jgi:isoleucyl-tRNA synthetase
MKQVTIQDMDKIDQLTIAQLHQLSNAVQDKYDAYSFDEVFRLINQFVSDLSGFYLDFTKDILYIEAVSSPRRQSVQTVYYHITDTLVRLIAPMLPHTADEVLSYMPDPAAAFAQLLDMPPRVEVDQALIDLFENFYTLRDDVLKALELARSDKVIGKSFEAKLTLTLNADWKRYVDSLATNLQQALIVSQFEIVVADVASYTIEITKAQGHTCDRCWQVVETIDDGLCNRCESIVR